MSSNNEKITYEHRVDYKEVLYTAQEIQDLSTEQIIDDACLVLNNCSDVNLVKCSLYISAFRKELRERTDVQSEGLNKLSHSLSNCLEVLRSSNKLQEAFVMIRLDEWMKENHFTISNQEGAQHVEDHYEDCNSNNVNIEALANRDQNLNDELIIKEEFDGSKSNDDYSDSNSFTIRSTSDIVKNVYALLRSIRASGDLPNWMQRSEPSFEHEIAKDMDELLTRSDVTEWHCDMLSAAFKDASKLGLADLNKGNTMLMQALNEKVGKLTGNNSNLVTSENDEDSTDSLAILDNSDESNLDGFIVVEKAKMLNPQQPEASTINAASFSNGTDVIISDQSANDLAILDNSDESNLDGLIIIENTPQQPEVSDSSTMDHGILGYVYSYFGFGQ